MTQRSLVRPGLLPVLMLLTGCAGAVDTTASQPVAIDKETLIEHYIGDDAVIKTAEFGARDISQKYIVLSVVVGPDGKVRSATPKDGPERFYALARRIALDRTFVPFQQNGRAVSASFDLYVFLRPLEKRPASRIAFPEIQDWTSLRITLDRGFFCYGRCPQYQIEISGDGSVIYESTASVAVYGTHRGQIADGVVRELFDAFRKADFFWAEDKYPLPPDEFPVDAGGSLTLSISFDGKTKSIEQGYSLTTGLPDAILALGAKIDDAVGSAKWVDGNAETISALRAEGWDFGSETADNKETLVGVVRFAPAHVAVDLISLGVPLDGRVQVGATYLTPFAGAIGRVQAKATDESILQALLNRTLNASASQRNDALWQAAASGRIDIVDALLKSGAYPHFRDEEGVSVLVQAIRSKSPELVAAILKTAPDVKLRDDSGQAPLHWVFEGPPAENLAERAEIVRMLVRAGAEVDVRDSYMSETALGMNMHSADIARALLAGGADVNARNRDGFTPLVRSNSAELTRVLLEAGADPWLQVQGVTVYDWMHREQNYYTDDVLKVLDDFVAAHPKPVNR